jgi:hypothetical protein
MTITHRFVECPFRFPNGVRCSALISVEHLINQHVPSCGSCGRAFSLAEIHAMRQVGERKP